ncbi:hypothetical protein, partial [Mycoplasmopsis pullorum]
EYYIKDLWEEDIENNTNKRFDYFHCKSCYWFILSFLSNNSTEFKIDEQENQKLCFSITIGFGLKKNGTNISIANATKNLNKIYDKNILKIYREIFYKAYENENSTDIFIKSPKFKNIEKIIFYSSI